MPIPPQKTSCLQLFLFSVATKKLTWKTTRPAKSWRDSFSSSVARLFSSNSSIRALAWVISSCNMVSQSYQTTSSRFTVLDLSLSPRVAVISFTLSRRSLCRWLASSRPSSAVSNLDCRSLVSWLCFSCMLSRDLLSSDTSSLKSSRSLASCSSFDARTDSSDESAEACAFRKGTPLTPLLGGVPRSTVGGISALSGFVVGCITKSSFLHIHCGDHTVGMSSRSDRCSRSSSWTGCADSSCVTGLSALRGEFVAVGFFFCFFFFDLDMVAPVKDLSKGLLNA